MRDQRGLNLWALVLASPPNCLCDVTSCLTLPSAVYWLTRLLHHHGLYPSNSNLKQALLPERLSSTNFATATAKATNEGFVWFFFLYTISEAGSCQFKENDYYTCQEIGWETQAKATCIIVHSFFHSNPCLHVLKFLGKVHKSRKLLL